jgi:SAM-dependent methyltransferase
VPINFEAERAFFDKVASETVVTPMSRATLDRYAHPRHPTLFAKEMMFALLPETRPLRVLEIGCGEGVASVQLAYSGADVTGLDISPVSIAIARKRAEVQGLDIKFDVINVVDAENLGIECYDVVWCDLILHHLVEPLDRIVSKMWTALKPGGRFIAREPVQYSGWLKSMRRLVPVRVDTTPDEKPFGPEEFAIMEKHFPGLHRRSFRIFARIDRITQRLPVIAWAARLDNLLFCIPGCKSLAGNAVMWAEKS